MLPLKEELSPVLAVAFQVGRDEELLGQLGADVVPGQREQLLLGSQEGFFVSSLKLGEVIQVIEGLAIVVELVCLGLLRHNFIL